MTWSFDQYSATTGGPGNQPGNVTTSEAELLITDWGAPPGSSGAFSITEGFTIDPSGGVEYDSGVNEGGAMAYLVQGSAGSANPTWAIGSGGTGGGAIMAAFKTTGALPSEPIAALAQALPGGSGGTTASLNLAGANLIVFGLASYFATGLSFSDSQGNSYATPIPGPNTNEPNVWLTYAIGSSIGADGMTFTVSGSNVYGAAFVMGFSDGGGASFTFPTAGWNWNRQAPVLAFLYSAAQKEWVWQKQPPALSFTIALTAKAWRWNAHAPGFVLTITAASKAWAWISGAPVLSRTIVFTAAAWRWVGIGAIFSGGNISGGARRFVYGLVARIGRLMTR